MEIHEEQVHEKVIRQAIDCAVVYETNKYGQHTSGPTRVIDMATTGGIPEGYTHLIFVGFDKTGDVVSRNLGGEYKVEIHDRIISL